MNLRDDYLSFMVIHMFSFYFLWISSHQWSSNHSNHIAEVLGLDQTTVTRLSSHQRQRWRKWSSPQGVFLFGCWAGRKCLDWKYIKLLLQDLDSGRTCTEPSALPHWNDKKSVASWFCSQIYLFPLQKWPHHFGAGQKSAIVKLSSIYSTVFLRQPTTDFRLPKTDKVKDDLGSRGPMDVKIWFLVHGFSSPWVVKLDDFPQF